MGIGLAFGLASRLDLIDGTVIALLGVTLGRSRRPCASGDTLHAAITVTEMRGTRHADRGVAHAGPSRW